MFNDKHLSDLRKATRSLQGQCNAGVSHADKKGLWYSIFDMWLVHNGITNITPLPWLEKDGFYVIYDTLNSWIVHYLDRTPILFEQDTGLCDQSPYVDIQYLNTIKYESVKILQTVRGDFEGFTKREVENSNLDSKAQTILGSPSEK